MELLEDRLEGLDVPQPPVDLPLRGGYSCYNYYNTRNNFYNHVLNPLEGLDVPQPPANLPLRGGRAVTFIT